MTAPQLTWEEILPKKNNPYWKHADFSAWQSIGSLALAPTQTESLQVLVRDRRLTTAGACFVWVNGCFVEALSDVAGSPIRYTREKKTKEKIQFSKDQYPFAYFNAQQSSEELLLSVPANTEIASPIHLLFITTASESFIAHPQIRWSIGDGAKLTVFEEHANAEEASYVINQVSTISLGKGAVCHYHKLQKEGNAAMQLATISLNQQQDSQALFTFTSCGAAFARDDLVVKLAESGASCATYGFYHLQQADQYIDHHIDIVHDAAYTQSDMLYKGILKDQSRAVFNGRVTIQKDAKKAVARQANHNLLLANTAEVFSQPDLAVHAEDVRSCKHGVTVGQVDQDALFYLTTRGIPRSEAMAMLLAGFAEEMMHFISNNDVKKRIQQVIA
ncbi:MAG TPA: SufD family Fe-S cluster assembly protein [Gammaproteobacteria bacterium]|jgi:Fe-S cluster assembly protein SufD|nr:SufD family Fe-S cluster assembly protein [Gammaproteobacteria bacterium]